MAITLQWVHHKIGDAGYYYAYHMARFWCVKADYVKDGVIIDEEQIFMVKRAAQLSNKAAAALQQRLCELFPHLTLAEIKAALI